MTDRIRFFIIMPELNKDIISFLHFRNHFFPTSFRNKAFGTAPVGGMIVYPYIFGKETGKHHSPSPFGISPIHLFICHRRITDHKDSDNRFIRTECRQKNKSRRQQPYHFISLYFHTYLTLIILLSYIQKKRFPLSPITFDSQTAYYQTVRW